MLIFLDTTLLWLLAHPRGGPEARALRLALVRRLKAGDQPAVAEICDYEARRELIRKGATRQIDNLDDLINTSTYVPLDTGTMREAASLWAQLRRGGTPTAGQEALDGDVILAAQAIRQGPHLVATKNLRHLAGVCNALEWGNL
jgi:predicted nucleic acid-binding protein